MDRVARLIEASQELDPGRRRSAEASLLHEINNATAGFGSNLLTIGLEPAVPPHIRQAAFILLRRLVKEKWEGGLTDSECTHIRANLPRGLFCGVPKVANSVGAVIAEIASNDFPDAWPSLLQDLMNVIDTHHADNTVVYACVKCAQLIAEDCADVCTTELVPLVPLMAQIANETRFATNVRCRALRTLQNILLAAQHIDPDEDDIMPLFNSISPFAESLVQCALQPGEGPDMFLCWEALRLVRFLIVVFPKQSLGIVDFVVPPLLSRLVAAQPVILEQFSKSADDGWVESDYTSDGEEVSVDVLTYRRLELLHALLSGSKKLAVAVRGLVKPQIENLVVLLLGYVTLPQPTVSNWISDVNAFLVDIEIQEEGESTEIRGLALEILRVVSARNMKTVLASVGSLLDDVNNPVRLEVGIMALTHLLLTRSQDIISNFSGALSSTLVTLSTSVVPNIAPEDPHMVMTASCLLFQRALEHADALSPDTIECVRNTLARIVERVVTGPRPPMYLAAIVFRSLFAAQVVLPPPIAHAALDVVLSLLCDAAIQGEVHVLVLDTMSYLLSRCRESLSEDALSRVPRRLLQSWLMHPTRATSDVYCSVFQELARCPASLNELMSHIFPWTLQVLEGTVCVPMGFATHLVALLTIYLKKVPQDVFMQLLEVFFAPVCTHMLISDDADAIQAGSLCLRVMVYRGGEIFSHRSFGVMISVLENRLPGVDEDIVPVLGTRILFRVLESLFTQERDNGAESSKLYAGRIVHEVIRDLRNVLTVDDISVMLDFVIRFAKSAKSAVLAQEMMVSIARVFGLFPENTINFLVSRGAAADVLPRWIEQHADFYGESDFCVSCLALCDVLRVGDPRLADIPVEFTIVQSPANGGVTTRSTCRKERVHVPLTAAIFTALARSLLRLQDHIANEGREGAGNGNGDGDDDGFEDDIDSSDSEDGKGGGTRGSGRAGRHCYLSDLLDGDDDDGECLEMRESTISLQGGVMASAEEDEAYFASSPAMPTRELMEKVRLTILPLAETHGPRVSMLFTAHEQQRLFALMK
eukprot:PhM_4_TR7910/c0_g1_i1/m.102236/K20224/IPO9, RANBP9; importin-9